METNTRMKLKPAKRKKNVKENVLPPFPLYETHNGLRIFKARFNGFSVIVPNQIDMTIMSTMGYFGKGNLSRSLPSYDVESIIRRKNREVVLVHDSDSDSPDSSERAHLPKAIQKSPVVETLNLMLEEAFFLSCSLKCLAVTYGGVTLEPSEMWRLFCEAQKGFAQSYGVYHYFRARRWVVKPGLKFGGDFLLYKQGPPFHHSSYLVTIDLLDNNLQRTSEDVDWKKIIGLNRLAETAAKEVLICQVSFVGDYTLEKIMESHELLNKMTVNPVLMRRWIPKQERNFSN